jgi:hypothetical protein
MNLLKEGVCHVFNRKGQSVDASIQILKCKHFNTPLLEEALLFQTPNPLKTLFPAIKMFPELRYIRKILENPTGRRQGQKSSLSHAIQEAVHKIFALQDSTAQKPNSHG